MIAAARHPSIALGRRTGQPLAIDGSSFQSANRGRVKRKGEPCVALRVHTSIGATAAIIMKLFESTNYLSFQQIELHTGLSEGEIIQMKPEVEALLRTSAGDWSHIC